MSANIRSIAALRDFRVALITYIDDASVAVQSMVMELQRTFEWIEHDRPFYWNGQLKRGFDLVAQTRSNMDSCLMRTVAGHRPSCIEEKQAYARAKQRLQHCQDHMQFVKQVANHLHHDADEFQGRMAGLQTLLDNDLPKAVARLEKAVTILESYAEIARPSDESQL